eukprot:18413-Pelagococcus_subviridis.AAC.2
MRDPPRLLAQRHGANVQFLNVVDASDRELALRRQRERVRERVAVERTHVKHLPQVHVAVDELLVLRVYDRRSVAAREHVRRVFIPKRFQRDRLRVVPYERTSGWS